MTASKPFSSDGKASACNAGDLGSIPGSGRSLGEGNGNPLQYSCPANQDVLMPADTAAATAAKSLQSCPTLVVSKVDSESEVTSRVRLLTTPWTVTYQAPQFMGFSRQEYWSGLPFPSPRDLLNPGIEPRSPALQADPLPSEPPGNPLT